MTPEVFCLLGVVEEIDRLKRVLSQLDEERDSLQASLDEQQEANVTLQREQQAYERALRRIEADKQVQRHTQNTLAAPGQPHVWRELEGPCPPTFWCPQRVGSQCGASAGRSYD